jgi:purine-cytosine permease-like protein
MSSLAIRALRVVLVLLALGVLAAAVLVVVVPLTQLSRPVDGLDVTYMVGWLLALGCVEVGLFAVGVLLNRVAREAIFDESADRWVWVIAATGLVAALVVGAMAVSVGRLADAPGMVLIGGAVGVAGVAFALLMTVMLGLLRTATRLRRELEAVV